MVSACEMGTNGFVNIENRHIRNDYEDNIAHAQFFNVHSEREEFMDMEYIIQVDGLDECSLGIWLEEGFGSLEDPVDWLNAGDVSLEAGENTFDMNWDSINWDSINWESQSVRYFVGAFSEDVLGHLGAMPIT